MKIYETMDNFKKLFGMNPSDVKETCVLTPFLTKGLIESYGVSDFSRGVPYSAGNSKDFTLIYTKVGASMFGDCVLYLNETECQNLIMHGACGLLKETDALKIGNLVAPTSCIAMESFSEILTGDIDTTNKVFADNILFKQLAKVFQNNSVTEVCCATFGSLKHEVEKREFLLDAGIDVLDMECSAFFLAAKHIGRKALALFYITDIVGEDSYKNIFIKDADPEVLKGEQKLIKLVCETAKKLSTT